MALRTTDYSKVLKLVKAKIGGTIPPEMDDSLQALINSAAEMIYDHPVSVYNERFLVVEPRSVVRGYIQHDEDGYNVFGAGTADVDGLYQSDDAATSYTNSNGLFRIEDNGATWDLVNVETSEVLYEGGGSNATPPVDGAWNVVNGESPAPYVQALSNIDTVIGAWNGQKWVENSPQARLFYPDQNGIKMTTDYDDVIYLAFRKELEDEYGDGTAGTVDQVPSEWVQYIAYIVARDYQIGAGDKDDAVVALGSIDRVLDNYLLRISKQGVWETIANTTRTRYGTDRSVR